MRKALNPMRFRVKPHTQWDKETLSYILLFNTQRSIQISPFDGLLSGVGERSL
jgi:hypothetical protein